MRSLSTKTSYIVALAICAPLSDAVQFENAIDTNATPISARLRIMADSQLHEFHGAPTFLMSRAADEMSEVAVRTSQQRLFAKDLLRSAMTLSSGAREFPTIVHLGDAVDVSCKSEWEQFVDAMDSVGRNWLLAPGNHDGFYIGNWLPDKGKRTRNVFSPKYGSEGWRLRCSVANTTPNDAFRLDKNELARRYLEKFGGTPTRSKDCGESGCETFELARSGHQVFAKIVSKQPWKSYLLQSMDFSNSECVLRNDACVRSTLVLIDTSVYGERPKVPYPLAGLIGAIGSEQWDKAEYWIKSYSGNVVLVGHHPYDKLPNRDQQKLLELSCKQTIPLYVSAHTHDGYWREWPCPGSNRVLIELNVGSVLDWPVHFRTLQLYRRQDGRLAIGSDYIGMRTDSAELNCSSAWFPKADSERDAGKQNLDAGYATTIELGRISLLNGLAAELREYSALIQQFPTVAPTKYFESDTAALDQIQKAIDSIDKPTNRSPSRARLQPQILLEKLELFENLRGVSDSASRNRYRTCLGLWAAERDYNRPRQQAMRRGGGAGPEDATRRNRELVFVTIDRN